jgi:hypothetical protein
VGGHRGDGDGPHACMQARGGWKREDQRIKQELAVRERLARKAGRLPSSQGATSSAGAPSSSAALKKRKAEGLPGGEAATTALKRIRALIGVVASAGKKEQKLADDVAKVMDRMLAKVERAVLAEVRVHMTDGCRLGGVGPEDACLLGVDTWTRPLRCLGAKEDTSSALQCAVTLGSAQCVWSGATSNIPAPQVAPKPWRHGDITSLSGHCVLVVLAFETSTFEMSSTC